MIQRFERDGQYLDLEKYTGKSLDEDGCAVYDEIWEVTIFPKKGVPSEGEHIDFACEALVRMFITENGWKEQVL